MLVGVDIVKVERIKESLVRTPSLKEKLFSNKEIQYCETKKNKYESYAVRYAAKEAYLKAIGTGITDFDLSYIEVINEENGKPVMYVNNEKIKGDISLSHTKDDAIAFVCLETSSLL